MGTPISFLGISSGELTNLIVLGLVLALGLVLMRFAVRLSVRALRAGCLTAVALMLLVLVAMMLN